MYEEKIIKNLFLVLSSIFTIFIVSGCNGEDVVSNAIKNGLFGNNEYNKTILDNSSVIIDINVNTQYTTLTKLVYVQIDLSHKRLGDLKIELISPKGTAVILSNYRGGNKSVNALLTFKDDTSESIINYNNSLKEYKPEAPLSTFIGENPKGIWHLKISDSIKNNKIGYITNVILFINGDK